MALVDGARIKEVTSTTGTGTLTLGGAPAGYRGFDVIMAEGDTCFYWLQDANGTAWECGIGTLTSSAGQLFDRTTIISSSNGGSAISLSDGTHILVNAPVPGYATGDWNMQDLLLRRPQIVQYSEKVSSLTHNSGSTLSLNLANGNVFNITQSSNITSVSVSNVPSSGLCASFTLILTLSSSGYTTAFPASFKWDGGVAPTLSTLSGGSNILTFFTVNGGSTWYGTFVGKDYA